MMESPIGTEFENGERALAWMAEGRHGMEKIVIISSQLCKDFIALLGMLFPNCQIRVVSSRIEAHGEALIPRSLEISNRWGIKANGLMNEGVELSYGS